MRNAALTAATSVRLMTLPLSKCLPLLVRTTPGPGFLPDLRHASLRSGQVKRLDRPRLPEGVVQAKELRCTSRDRVGEVVQLEPIRVRRLHRDGLDLSRNLASDATGRSEEHTSELQSQSNIVCR